MTKVYKKYLLNKLKDQLKELQEEALYIERDLTTIDQINECCYGLEQVIKDFNKIKPKK